jgi:putative flippase GtrA
MLVVIPAYEPDHRLIDLVMNIQGNCNYDIIIVNDGSSPSCNTIFQEAGELGCTILVHESNLGKGNALRTAFSYIINNRLQDNVVCADCDGQHSWQDILKIAKAVCTHTNSIVLGCRDFIGKVPARSLLGNRITSFVYSLVTSRKISDTQTGLRGFSASLLPWLVTVKGNRYEYEMNQLLEVKDAGFEIFCLPIETIYENNNEASHFNPVRDSIRIYLPIIKFILSSAACGAIDFIALFATNAFTHNLLFSVVTARIISSLCNYLINRDIVFRSQKNSYTIVKYYALAIIILGCNYTMLRLFTNIAGLPLIISKLITEGILYFFSYIVQHKIIFKQEE